MTLPLILASGSPRRKQLLETLRLPIEIVPSDTDETPRPGESGTDLVKRLAEEKARAVAVVYPTRWIVACDTIVELDGRILGKPSDAKDAEATLRSLQGQTHRVHSGLCLMRGGEFHVSLNTTEVKMRPMTPDEIAWYVGTGEPLDKAGSYGIQGIGGLFVAGIQGSYSNVMGMPVELLVSQMKELELLEAYLGIGG